MAPLQLAYLYRQQLFDDIFVLRLEPLVAVLQHTDGSLGFEIG